MSLPDNVHDTAVRLPRAYPPFAARHIESPGRRTTSTTPWCARCVAISRTLGSATCRYLGTMRRGVQRGRCVVVGGVVDDSPGSQRSASARCSVGVMCDPGRAWLRVPPHGAACTMWHLPRIGNTGEPARLNRELSSISWIYSGSGGSSPSLRSTPTPGCSSGRNRCSDLHNQCRMSCGRVVGQRLVDPCCVGRNSPGDVVHVSRARGR